MIRVLVVGYGKMGKMIVETIEQRKDMKVVMIADHSNHPDVAQLQEPVDVIIDFSHPDNLSWIIDFLHKQPCALVCGTTGYSDLQKRQIEDLANQVPVIFQANFSQGIAVFQEILKLITPMLEDSFDMEIVEKHHNQKQDAPSGTAKMLAEIMNSEHTYKEVHGRNGFIGKRQKEIGIHALRGGSVAGEHSVYFFGEDEILEIKHTANSRKIFVNGAIKAAAFIVKQAPGMYTMKDILFA